MNPSERIHPAKASWATQSTKLPAQIFFNYIIDSRSARRGDSCEARRPLGSWN